MKGSLLQNKRIPAVGDSVWFLSNNGPSYGAVVNVFNIDCDLEYVSCDIFGGVDGIVKFDEYIAHTQLNSIFDHCPIQVVINDYFGKVTVWE